MQRVSLVLVDDFDTRDIADDSVHFGLDGVDYTIDLTAEKAGRLREVLAEYIGHARRVTVRRPPSSAQRSGGRNRRPAQRSAAIRAWAHGAGVAVSARGRIPQPVQDQYEAAQSGARADGGAA